MKNAPEVAVAPRKRTLEGKILSTELKAESDGSLTEDKCIQKQGKQGNPENESVRNLRTFSSFVMHHVPNRNETRNIDFK